LVLRRQQRRAEIGGIVFAEAPDQRKWSGVMPKVSNKFFSAVENTSNKDMSMDVPVGAVVLMFDVQGYRDNAERLFEAGVELPTWGGAGSDYPNRPKCYNFPAEMPASLILTAKGFSIPVSDAPVMTLAEAKQAFIDDKITRAEFDAVKAQYTK
jgi:hypothetical protein